jgi:hypothetical protein
MDIKEAIHKSLFFLGAGASKTAGCKLSSEMLIDLKERIQCDTDSTFLKSEKKALNFILSCLQYHNEWRTLDLSDKDFSFTPNIEELALIIRRIRNRENFIPYPITGNWSDKLTQLEYKFQRDPSEEKKRGKTLLESLDYKLKCELLPDWLNFNIENLTYLKILAEFFQSYPNDNFRLDIFSLNNDIVIEEFSKQYHLSPWRGFSNGKWVGLDVDELNFSDFDRINLFKLHGSIDWVRLNTNEFKQKQDLIEQDEENIEKYHNPFVIFGQGTKTFSIEPFFSLVQHFKRKLSEKEYYFVIGYSFFDPYINNLLIESTRGNNKKVIIINPNFGPDTIKHINKETNEKKLIYNENDFFKIKYPDGIDVNILAKYIEKVQNNAFYSELPEYNISQITSNNIELLPIGFDVFLQKFFENKGQLFLNFINDLEKKKNEDEKPF